MFQPVHVNEHDLGVRQFNMLCLWARQGLALKRSAPATQAVKVYM